MSAPYYQDEQVTVLAGDCLEVLRSLPDASVHAVVTDPPYGLANTSPEQVADTIVRWVNGDRDYLPGGSGFMGKAWDAFVPPVAVWDECLRVLKPGGHVLAFAGSRTHDLMSLGIRLAGFEVRDSIAWLYGSGFPKSLDVSKAIDKGEGHWRGRAGSVESDNASMGGLNYERTPKGDPVTAAAAWQGWGTALKPAFEPIVVARKPLARTVAANVLEHGTGALNIDGCRVGDETLPEQRAGAARIGTFERQNMVTPERIGRWPANVILDDTQAAELDRQSGTSVSRVGKPRGAESGDGWGMTATGAEYDDQGGASRFFPTFRYEAKAPTEERPRVNGIAHPTVKPLSLISWLVRLVTPPGGTILDPFAGSGTTLEAALIEGFQCIGIEREADYLPLIKARITKPLEPVLDLGGIA